MSDLLDDLATISGVQEYLQNNPLFAAHTVQKLLGGMGNFAYRIHLVKPFAGRATFVLKYAPPYAASSRGTFPLDQKRQVIEVKALHLANQISIPTIPAFIKTPAVHVFDKERHVIIMDDAGEDSRTLKEILIKEGLPLAVSKQIGSALGEFISGIHTWNQNSGEDLTEFANNQLGKYITAWMTYGQLESTLTGKDDIPTLSDPLLGISEANMIVISKIVEKRQKAIYAASAIDPITHGDLWPGNIVLTLTRREDGTIVGVENLYVLDWEVCKTGLPGLDLGQFCAELYILSEFYPGRSQTSLAIIESFLDAYRKRMGMGEDTVFARMVISHIGAHVVALTPRVSSWSGREKTREVVESGVEMLVLGEEGPELSLRTSIVEPLLRQ